MCVKLTIMTLEQRQCYRSGDLIINFRFYKFIWCSIGDFEKVNAGSVDEL